MEKMDGEQESVEPLLDRYVKEMDKRLYTGFQQVLSESFSEFQNELFGLLKEEQRGRQQAEILANQQKTLAEQREKLEQLSREVEELKKEQKENPPKPKKRFKLFR